MNIKGIIKNTASKLIEIAYKAVYRFIGIDDKTVLFIAFHGKGYSDSPKAIYEEMLKDERFKNYKFEYGAHFEPLASLLFEPVISL